MNKDTPKPKTQEAPPAQQEKESAPSRVYFLDDPKFDARSRTPEQIKHLQDKMKALEGDGDDNET